MVAERLFGGKDVGGAVERQHHRAPGQLLEVGDIPVPARIQVEPGDDPLGPERVHNFLSIGPPETLEDPQRVEVAPGALLDDERDLVIEHPTAVDRGLDELAGHRLQGPLYHFGVVVQVLGEFDHRAAQREPEEGVAGERGGGIHGNNPPFRPFILALEDAGDYLIQCLVQLRWRDVQDAEYEVLGHELHPAYLRNGGVVFRLQHLLLTCLVSVVIGQFHARIGQPEPEGQRHYRFHHHYRLPGNAAQVQVPPPNIIEHLVYGIICFVLVSVELRCGHTRDPGEWCCGGQNSNRYAVRLLQLYCGLHSFLGSHRFAGHLYPPLITSRQ
ncbi:hypothetical protein ES703_80017 [subsurface metagenome]